MKLVRPSSRRALPAPAPAALLERAAGCPLLPRIHVISDVHLETGAYELPVGLDFDILIAAGDIGPVEMSVPWLAKVGKPVVYVLGNHEHWGTDFGEAPKLARKLARGTQVHVLERDEVELMGVRFLGATLWTDFGDWHRDLVAQALKRNRDYTEIGALSWWGRKANQRLAQRLADEAGYRHTSLDKFSPTIAYEEHQKSLLWLKEQLKGHRQSPTVVVSHHAPTRESLLAAGVDAQYLDPRYWSSRERDAARVANYASPVLDAKLTHESYHVALWAHGHLHHAIDLTVEGTRVVANPRGYAHRPLTEADIRVSGLFGYPLTAEDVARSQAAHAADPYAGDGTHFEGTLVLRFGDGLRQPLERALAPKLEALDGLIAENEELLPLVRKGGDLATRCVERVFHENSDRFTAILQAIQAKEGRAIDPQCRNLSLSRFKAPNKYPSKPWGSIRRRLLTRKAYSEELVLMREWRKWVSLVPRAAELALRSWVRQGVRGLEALKAAGITATVSPLGFESLRRLGYRDLEFLVDDKTQHAQASKLLEQVFNGGTVPRDVFISIRSDSLWEGAAGEARTLAEMRALQREFDKAKGG